MLVAAALIYRVKLQLDADVRHNLFVVVVDAGEEVDWIGGFDRCEHVGLQTLWEVDGYRNRLGIQAG